MEGLPDKVILLVIINNLHMVCLAFSLTDSHDAAATILKRLHLVRCGMWPVSAVTEGLEISATFLKVNELNTLNH